MKKYESLEKGWKKNRSLFYALCIGLTGVGCLQEAVKSYQYYEADQSYQQMEADAVMSSDDNRCCEEVQRDNLNVIGWITIEQLDISYPVVQGEDNIFYLQHLANGKSNASGSIMLNCDNQVTFTDQNTIIYGHNMKDGSMFGRLKQLRELTEPYEEFRITAAGREYSCHIFAIAEVEVSHSIYQINYDKGAFQNCLRELKRKACYWETPSEEPEHIVTLSTCMGDQRLVVVAAIRG